jgi:hypothetical protein
MRLIPGDFFLKLSLICAAVLSFQLQSFAQVMPEPEAAISPARQRAALIYQRLAGVKAPIDAPILKQMETMIAAGNAVGAAALATNDPNFYNLTVKQLAAKMSTREETITVNLNDFVATFIGVVRDDRSAKELLTGNYIYVGDFTRFPAAIQTQINGNTNLANSVKIDTDFQVEQNLLSGNRHYDNLHSLNLDLSAVLTRREGQPVLVRRQQADNNVVTRPTTLRNNPDAAGLLTTRAFTGAHAVAGTNRRMVHFAFREFMCIDITQWADAQAPDVRVGRDVPRAPGGEPGFYLTSCKTCHSVMDGFRGAFASVDHPTNLEFTTQLLFTDQEGASRQTGLNNGQLQPGSAVASKYARNNTEFPAGYITLDSSWVNYADLGTNAQYFGWRGTNTKFGAGVRSFGQLLADSQAFSRCMVKRVYKSACRREPSSTETDFIAREITNFEADYNLKRLYQRVAVSPACIGN